MYVKQPALDMLELKEDKSTDYVIGWKSDGLFKSKLLSLHGAFLPIIKYTGYKIGIQFNNPSLVIYQQNFTIKIVNVYMVFDLHTWPKILLKKFILKSPLFDATNIAKSSDKTKQVYCSWRIT